MTHFFEWPDPRVATPGRDIYLLRYNINIHVFTIFVLRGSVGGVERLFIFSLISLPNCCCLVRLRYGSDIM